MSVKEIKTIEAGKTVSGFISDLNNNFDALKGQIDNQTNAKQNKIFIAKNGDTVKVNNVDYIKINDEGVPTGGKNGDILIVYEG